MSHSIIALITDFGDQDGFVGVMKGVILSRYPNVHLVDIAHHISPQNIRHGSWVLNQAFDEFPPGTFFLCVVDPDVGNPQQKKLAFYSQRLKKGLVLPDNGLATRILQRYPNDFSCVSLENPQFFRAGKTVSQTFHGKDIYAPAATHLAKVFAENTIESFIPTLGPAVSLEDLTFLDIQHPVQIDALVIQGQIDIIDVFGNLITNIPANEPFHPGDLLQIELAGKTHEAFYASHYQAAFKATEKSPLFVIIPGSHGMLEISLPQGDAATTLGVSPCTSIHFKKQSSPAGSPL